MVHYGTLFTLFLAAVAQAHDNLYDGPYSVQPPPSSSSSLPAVSPSLGSSVSIGPSLVVLPSGTGSSGSSQPPLTTTPPTPVISYVTVFETKTTTKVEYKTVTRTKTIESCPTPGNPNHGKPTSVVKPNDKPTSVVKPNDKPTSAVKPNDKPTTTSRSPPQSTQTLLPTSVTPPASPTPTPTPAPNYPEDDEDLEYCEDDEDDHDDDEEDDDGDDEDCEDDEQDDVSSGLPVSSSIEPKPSSYGSPTNTGVTSPPTLIALPSSSVPYPVPSDTVVSSPSPSVPYPVPSDTVVSSPSPSSPASVPSSSSSVIPSPVSSVISSTGAPKPASTGKYDRNAICGNQKREPSPLEVVPQFSRRDLRRRITY